MQRTEVRPRGDGPVAGRSRGGQPAPEEARVVEALADQARADESALRIAQQAPVCLLVERDLRDRGDEQRIEDTRQDAQDEQRDQRGTQFTDCLLYTSDAADERSS